MFGESKVVVVMPAYNAEKTLRHTYTEVISQDYVDDVILVDDSSSDSTVALARELGVAHVVRHQRNLGYGANQKTCYRAALERGADIVVMVHPDYQYTPKLIPAMVTLIGNGLYSCVIGSRILGGHAVANGMPWWRYVANRALTFFSNLVLGAKLSEYHTGYRAFSRQLLEQLPIDENSDDFVFDDQMLSQVLWCGVTIAEISCPTRYFEDASSIDLRRSVIYGLGCLGTSLEYAMARAGLRRSRRFPRALFGAGLRPRELRGRSAGRPEEGSSRSVQGLEETR